MQCFRTSSIGYQSQCCESFDHGHQSVQIHWHPRKWVCSLQEKSLVLHSPVENRISWGSCQSYHLLDIWTVSFPVFNHLHIEHPKSLDTSWKSMEARTWLPVSLFPGMVWTLWIEDFNQISYPRSTTGCQRRNQLMPIKPTTLRTGSRKLRHRTGLLILKMHISKWLRNIGMRRWMKKRSITSRRCIKREVLIILRKLRELQANLSQVVVLVGDEKGRF